MNNTFTLIVSKSKRYSTINIFKNVYLLKWYLCNTILYLKNGTICIIYWKFTNFAILYAVMYLNILQSLEGKEQENIIILFVNYYIFLYN